MLRTTLSRNRRIFLSTARGLARNAVRHPAELRHHVVRDAWTVAKRFAAASVENIELREIPCVHQAIVEGYLDDQQRLVLAALARGTGARTFFEIGTNRGRTPWTLAHNNPTMTLYTLDVPVGQSSDATTFDLASDDRRFFRPESECGEAFRGTSEAERITQLWGDSAAFDFAGFAGTIDLVYIDGAHTYDYVKSDSENALRMLTPGGTIVWDDYASNPDIHTYVNELAAALDRPVYHVFGTRMALYPRQDIVVRLPFDDHASLASV